MRARVEDLLGSPVQLRPATAADRPGLVRIWRRAVEATHAFLTPGEVDRIEAQVRADVLPALAVTVAVRDHTPVGWIGVDGDRVEALFVDPGAHRGGVGTALLDSVVSVRPVVLLDVNEQNPGALAFYLARGFVRTGRSERDAEGRPFPVIHLRRG
ncbi:hypothetical protein AFB00_06815 [Pseudonocardia sp. HH130630-07]|nr:hypothetical protein AFB00_06815 [Pseudonocardia sp. HH130630-07]